MTIPLELIEPESWPAIRERIALKITSGMDGLLLVRTIEAMRFEQGFIEGLKWVIEEGKPLPRQEKEEDDC